MAGIVPSQYKDLKTLLACESIVSEDPETQRLIRDLRAVRKRGHLTREELLRICKWKSARSLPLCRKNTPERVAQVSARAFAAPLERDRFRLLTSLSGVGPPMASAILTLTDPEHYGVIDIRVWQTLYKLRSVHQKPKGVGFTFKDWYSYLKRLRYHAEGLGVSVRAVERTVFDYHRRIQEGRLYDSVVG